MGEEGGCGDDGGYSDTGPTMMIALGGRFARFHETPYRRSRYRRSTRLGGGRAVLLMKSSTVISYDRFSAVLAGRGGTPWL